MLEKENLRSWLHLLAIHSYYIKPYPYPYAKTRTTAGHATPEQSCKCRCSSLPFCPCSCSYYIICTPTGTFPGLHFNALFSLIAVSAVSLNELNPSSPLQERRLQLAQISPSEGNKISAWNAPLPGAHHPSSLIWFASAVSPLLSYRPANQ